MPIISVVIPVYKAEGCLSELYRRLVVSLEVISPDFEIILVEDCGGDQSWEIIQDLAKNDDRLKGMQFSRNFGQHYGITAGLDFCQGEWVVVMDCDLQDRPEEIPKLYAKAMEGFDIVLAIRGLRKHSIMKRLTSWMFYRIFSWLIEIPHDGRVGNFRIMSFKVVEQFRLFREQLRFLGGIINWLGFPTAQISVLHDERFAGESSYSYVKLFRLAAQMVIAYSDKPLRVAVGFGFFLTTISFGFGTYIMYRAICYGTPVVGWSSIIVSLYFLGGVLIAMLGILGIYLGKTFDETKKRPLYVIRRTTCQ